MKVKFLFFLFLFTLFFLSCSGRKELSLSEKKKLVKAIESFEKKEFDNAISFSDMILKEHPEEYSARILKIKSFYYQKKWKEALEESEKILKREPFHQGALLWEGRLLINMEKYEEAERTLLKGYENNSEDTVFAYELARLYREKGDIRKELKFLAKTQAWLYQLENSYTVYERTLRKEGLNQKADEALNKAELLRSIINQQ